MSTRYVVCLKYGKKYNHEYVNRLYNMVQRNLTLDHTFICFTENSKKLDKHIQIIPLEQHVDIGGWWYKPMFFKPGLLNGTILYLDLDIIIFRNIDKLFTYKPHQFLIIRDFNRSIIKNYQKFNSSVFRLESGQHTQVYTDFIKKPQLIINKFIGDQDWIRYAITKNFLFWPDEWIQSYKWEMRKRSPIEIGVKGKRDFRHNADPVILDDTAIAVFHGDPNPHYCKDQWVINHWK